MASPGWMPASCPSGLTARHGDLAGRELALKLLGELQDSQVLADARLGGLQAFGDPLTVRPVSISRW